jgi:pimeloyl-ACP methyl ester carboxylesterase
MKITGKKVSIFFAGIFLVLMLFFHSCMTFRKSPSEIDAYFKKKKVQAEQLSYKTGFREIHYVKAGSESKPLVVFIHGSPGSLDAFIHFLTDSILLDNALLITTDRPGFGYSNFGNGEPSLEKQADALIPILQKYRENRPVILVGHSLGGPLIARMAIDYPDLVDGLIIVAGSVDPKLEPNETWFRAPLATPFLSWILPRSFRASNEEIYQLKPELEEMLPLWKNVTCPVIIIHGSKDVLVPVANVDFAKQMLVNAPVETVVIDNMNHFVPWSNPELIHRAIMKMLQRSNVAHEAVK